MVVTGEKSALAILIPVMVMVMVGCPPRPAPLTPGGDGGTGGMGGAPMAVSDDLTCAHLVDLGCPEGKDSACRQTLARLRQHPGVAPMPDLACILSARDRPSARKCRGLACPEMAP